MNAPTKIFLSKDLFRWGFDKKTDASDIEYIMKDALSNFIDSKISEWEKAPKHDFSNGCLGAYKTLKEALEQIG